MLENNKQIEIQSLGYSRQEIGLSFLDKDERSLELDKPNRTC